MGLRFALLFLFSITFLSTSVFSDLIISKVERRVDLTSQVVRTLSTLKVENAGRDVVSEVLLSFPEYQEKNLAYLIASLSEGKGKSKAPTLSLPVEAVYPEGMPPSLTLYSVLLPKGLSKGQTLTLDVLAIFTRALQPFPEQITQADTQLVLFQDSAYYLSPYEVKFQVVSFRLPSPRVESYTQLQNTKLVDSEIKYGPYENLPAFSYSAVVVHYENNRPFAVAQELVREIEISHWGNVQITEHYNLVHGGAHNKGGFSRLDYQARPHVRGVSSFRQLIARLPPRAHSVYYRDEIGNISTSHLRGDSRKVVLPEGSNNISFSVPFSVKKSQEVKYSHLDIVGRPVLVLERNNVVPEHNLHFQVYYKFSNLSLLREPLMLISGFFFLFITCIIYMHADLSISKSSASYLAKLQLDEVQATIQQIQNIINRCLGLHDKLETSLRDLSRTGDVQACKAARKAADSFLKELSKDLKPSLVFLQSCPQAVQIWPKVEDLVVKEKEIEEKLMLKHIMVVDSYEKKSGGREIENKVSVLQQKLTILRHEVDDLLEVIDEI
ncbi:hypothetical protein IFM89_002421 [Coptis chinensis]|uniref:Dolichyl-diphosphooligosaccharide--protein glycosyltransferase subunit 1 n=1 Tax=Coptis chinensis TaxID=261450 RepID=A0A835IJ47_9MAGN|nr:hypothetical protein IFM89_002421 [Coptis chinensis]